MLARTWIRLACSVAVLAALSGQWGRVVAAPRPSSEDPEVLIKEGVELRRQGQNARAEGYFRRAYELAATPRTAAQLGLAELSVGNFLDAQTHLEEALSSKDAWVNEHRKTLEESRAAARKKLVRIELAAAPAGTTFSVAGSEAKPLATSGVVWIVPGPATIHLEAEGYKSADVPVEGAAGDTRQITVNMPKLVVPKTAQPSVEPTVTPPPVTEPANPEPQPQPQPEAAPAPGRGMRIAGIVVASVGVATAVVGGILYSQGAAHFSRYRDAINSKGTIAYTPGDENYKTLETAGIGCLIGGGVALAGGAALYFVGRKAGQEEAPASAPASGVSMILGPDLGFLSYRGTF
jgi:hypothetical protein